MFGSPILDIAIGLIFFFLLLSLGFTAINELLASFLKHRATKLEEGIRQILKSPEYINKFYDHPLIKCLSNKNGRPPSYIPPRTFALTLLSITGGTLENFETFMTKLRESNDSDIKKVLLPIFESAQGKMNVAIKNVENWFDSSMDRVTGWYKRWTMLVTVIAASIICLAINADTIMVAKLLWIDSELRSSIATATEQYVNSADTTSMSVPTTSDSLVQKVSNSVQQLREANFPLGWTWMQDPVTSDISYKLRAVPMPAYDIVNGKTKWDYGNFIAALIYKFLGIAFTVLAITIGAPFWFDVLNSFVKLRSSIAPKHKKD